MLPEVKRGVNSPIGSFYDELCFCTLAGERASEEPRRALKRCAIFLKAITYLTSKAKFKTHKSTQI